MRTQLFKYLQPHKHHDNSHAPEIDCKGGTHIKPVSGEHTVTIPGRNIIERVQLQDRGSHGQSLFQEKLLAVHNGRQPHTELKADADDLGHVLKEYLDLLKADYDYIIIDGMPSLGMLTINEMTAADSVLIPTQPQYYASDGLTELLKVYKATKARFNPKMEIEGILYTMDVSRYNNSKRNKKAIKAAYGNELRIFNDSIPRLEPISEAASEGVSIFTYEKNGKGAESYQKLAQEVLNHAKEK